MLTVDDVKGLIKSSSRNRKGPAQREEDKRLGLRLMRLREKHGLDTVVVADTIRIDRTALAAIEAGKYTPGLRPIVRLSRFYKVSLDELLADFDKEPK